MTEHLDETFDTQVEVERNPCGAWMAIQAQSAELATLRARALVAAASAASRSAVSDEAVPLLITYTNWRGETAQRRIIPQSVWFGATDWHPEPQWLLKAMDADKGEIRDFAMRDMRMSPARDEALIRAALEAAAKEAERYASFPQPTSHAARYHEVHCVKPNIAATIRALATDDATIAAIRERAKG